MSNPTPTPTPRFTGIFIPAEILMREDLSSTDIMLLSWIDALQCEERGGCFASNEYFAAKLKLKVNTVKILISKLVELQLIERVSFDGRTRILRSCKEKWFSKSQSTAEVEKNQPQGLKKINRRGSEKSTRTYIYSKEERKEYIPAAPKKKIQENSSKEKKISFGKYVEFTNSQYESLCKIHGKDKVDDIIQRMEDHCVNNRPKGYKDYTAAFRTFLASYKPPQNEKSSNLSNREKVLKRFKNGQTYNGADCYITEHAIAFQRGITHLEVRFKDNGFEEQLANMLRKFGITS